MALRPSFYFINIVLGLTHRAPEGTRTPLRRVSQKNVDEAPWKGSEPASFAGRHDFVNGTGQTKPVTRCCTLVFGF
jgi:hypothetical protein